MFDVRIETRAQGGTTMYPHVRQFETRAFEAEAETRLAHERRAAAAKLRVAMPKHRGWNRVLSTGRTVPPRLGGCRD